MILLHLLAQTTSPTTQGAPPPFWANPIFLPLILLGVFKAKLAIAIIAFTGVVLASVYALRLFIRAMHNRVGAGVESKEISFADGLVIMPVVLVIGFLALYPQFALHRSERSVKGAVAQVEIQRIQGQIASAGHCPALAI